MMTAFDPLVDHGNGEGTPFGVMVLDHDVVGIEQVDDGQQSQLPTSMRQCVRACSFKKVSLRDEYLHGLKWLSSPKRLNFEAGAFGCAIVDTDCRYEILSAPEAVAGPIDDSVLLSARMKFTHHRGSRVVEVVATPVMSIVYDRDETYFGMVFNYVVGVESVSVRGFKDFDDYVLTGNDARDALVSDPRCAVIDDELLHLFLRCDRRVFTPMCASIDEIYDLAGHAVV